MRINSAVTEAKDMTQICRNCKLEKCLSEFGKDKKLELGYKYFCKKCFNVLYNSSRKSWKNKNKEKVKQQNSRYRKAHRQHLTFLENNRRAKKLQATPKWANLNKIKSIYRNCPKGYHVDHIIPLQGKEVCGLHVESNLQYLPAIENIRKRNKV